MGSNMEYEQLSQLKQINHNIKQLLSQTAVGTPVEQQLTCTRPEFIWSVEKDGNYNCDKILAKGPIGFGINTYDLSDLSWDRNGVYKV